MSEELENSVREMLKEETWTRTGITNFTKNNLDGLEKVLEQALNENCGDSIKAICDEQLTHNKESIVALYLSGMIALGQGSLDNSSLIYLADIFDKNHKEQLTEQLCTSILAKEPANKFALRRLAEYYKVMNDDKQWELYERIVKHDFEEAEIAKKLADRYLAQENKVAAVDYYKKALARFIAQKNATAVKEVWTILVEQIPEEIDYFMLMQQKIAKSISPERSAVFMQEPYKYYKNTANWDVAISILKLILTIDRKDAWARNEIIECFSSKYADNKHLQSYIEESNLNKSYRDVFEAITNFEKHIAFGVEKYVYHRTWGVGRIQKVQGDMLTINFGKKNGVRPMSLKMAVTALQPLPDTHIWVLKATKRKEALAEWVKKDIKGTLKTIITSFDNKCDEKRIKAELVESILTKGEWTNWHAKAQNILKTDPTFGVTPNDINQYMVREKPLTLEERLGNEFKAEKDFFPKIDILMRYIEDDSTDKASEVFSDMYSFFGSFLKSFSTVDVQIVASYLVIQFITKKIKSLPVVAKFTFEELYKEIENPREMYSQLKSSELKDAFMENVGQLPDWDIQYIRLFPTVLKQSLLDTLISRGKVDMVKKLVHDSFEDARNYRDAVVFFFKENRENEWFKEAGISYEKQLITLVNIISICNREINNHVNTIENKKTKKAATTLLFEEKVNGKAVNNMLEYMLSNEQATITRMYTLVNDVKDLDSTYKAQLRSGILQKYPDFKFQEAEIKQEAPKGLMVTAKMLDIKKAEAEELEKEILPKIADEVSEARAKGDLKENAEYSSAKERQALENQRLRRLKEELSEAVVFDPSTRTTSYVSFGTTVKIHDNIENKDITYTIWGPWESNTELGIISYLSPMGDHLLNAKLGENRKFTINDNKFDYTIQEIKVAAEI